jgi:hypothetical protein
MSMLRWCTLVHIASLRRVAHERLLQRRLGTTNLLVAQLLQARLGSDELAIDRFEVASISFISRVCVAMTVRNASCTLVDCSCSSLTSAVSASIWAALVTCSGSLLG